MILSKRAICGSKKSKFIKKQEASGILSSVGIRTPLNKIPDYAISFFECTSVECSSSENCKMNDIINKFLLAGDKFMLEMHLKQPGFTYSACGPFTKNKERIEKFKKNELDKACFQNDIAYGDFKGLARRIAADKV